MEKDKWVEVLVKVKRNVAKNVVWFMQDKVFVCCMATTIMVPMMLSMVVRMVTIIVAFEVIRCVEVVVLGKLIFVAIV